MKLRPEPGWHGVFTRDEAKGAWRNGTRVIKVAKDPSDANDVGATGQVLGSIGHANVGVGYFIEWDNYPKRAVFVAPWKIEPIVRH